MGRINYSPFTTYYFLIVAPDITTSKENPGKVIPLAIVLLGIVAGYIFYSTSLGGNVEVPPVVAAQDSTLAQFKDLNLDFSIFDDARFKSFKIFGESPVQPGSTGRLDIFAPY